MTTSPAEQETSVAEAAFQSQRTLARFWEGVNEGGEGPSKEFEGVRAGKAIEKRGRLVIAASEKEV